MNRPTIRFMNAIQRMDVLFRKALRSNNIAIKELFLSSIIVKLHDQWNYRCRQIICECYGGAEGKMLFKLQQAWTNGGRKMGASWEPDWHIPSVSLRAATLLNIRTVNNLQNAFGAVTYVDDLRWTRNAIVHNIPGTFRKYQDMALNKYQIKYISPYEIILQINPKTGNTIYEDWCNEMTISLSSAYSQ